MPKATLAAPRFGPGGRDAPLPAVPDRISAVVLLGLAALTLARLAGLVLSEAELDFEEAQYWTWSLEPAFGYYSKPPLIAWILRAAEALCGSGEACLRAPSPVLHFGTAVLVFLTARRLYGPWTATWTAALLALAPGMAFSARLMTTDVPLLLGWAAALYALLRLRETGSTRWAAALGAAIGFGLLAKYAMIYFVACAALYAAWDRDARAVLLSRRGGLALGIAAAIIAPNLIWNAVNGFPTFAHTQTNVAGRGLRFDTLKLLAFLAGQLALIGPILFAALVARLFGLGRTDRPEADRLLLAFSAPILAVLTVYAVVTPANANWTAPAYVAGVPLATAVLVHAGRTRLLGVSLAIGLISQVGLLIGDAFASRITLPGFPGRDPYARVQGWARLGQEVRVLASRTGARTVALMGRGDVALFSYYLRGSGVPVRVWPYARQPANHYEWTRPLSAGTEGPVLFVSPYPIRTILEKAYAETEELGPVTVMTGPTTTRTFWAYRLANPRGSVRPLSELFAGS